MQISDTQLIQYPYTSHFERYSVSQAPQNGVARIQFAEKAMDTNSEIGFHHKLCRGEVEEDRDT